jgi:CheY-like chemotaxis protein
MSQPKALIIEDSAVVRQFIRLELECRGWTVAEAADAHEGLKAFRRLAPQLITLDLIMPINDGLDAVQLAQLIQEEDPEVTLLVVSSSASNQDVKDFFEKHKLELFEKPRAENPRFDQLLARVDSIFHELNSRSN